MAGQPGTACGQSVVPDNPALFSAAYRAIAAEIREVEERLAGEVSEVSIARLALQDAQRREGVTRRRLERLQEALKALGEK